MKRSMDVTKRILKEYLKFTLIKRFPLWVQIGLHLLLLINHLTFLVLYIVLYILSLLISLARVPAEFIEQTLHENKDKHWAIQFAVYFIAYFNKFIFDLASAFQYLAVQIIYFLYALVGSLGSLSGVAFQPFLLQSNIDKVKVENSKTPSKKASIIVGVLAWFLVLSLPIPFFSKSLIDTIRNNQLYANAEAIVLEEEYSLIATQNKSKFIYTFTPSQSGDYVFLSTGEIDTHITLRNEAKELLGSDDDSYINLNFLLIYSLVKDETYYIEIESFFTSGLFHFIVFNDVDSFLDQNNNSFDGAFEISDMGSFTVSIADGGQEIYYSFSPASTGYYTFSSSGTKDTFFELYNSSQSMIASDDDSGDNLNFSKIIYLYSGSTYYAVFSLYGTQTGTFTVTLS